MAARFSTSQMVKIAISHFRGRDTLCPKCGDGVVRVRPKLMPGPHVILQAECPICHASGEATSDNYRALDLPRWTDEQARKIVTEAIDWVQPTCPVDGTALHVDRSQKGRNIVIAAVCPRCLNETTYEDKSR